jgi:hypothetical protein
MPRPYSLIASFTSLAWSLTCLSAPQAGEPTRSKFDYQIVRPAFTADDGPAEPDTDWVVTTALDSSEGERPDLTPQQIALRDRMRRVLRAYYPKHQNTRDNNAWEVMHEIIAYGVDAQLYQGGPGGPKVNAIGWMCFNGVCKGEQMLYLDHDRLVARKGPGVQGHFGQFLAILAQSHLTPEYPMLVFGKKFTLRDLIECEKLDCQAGDELTFKLIGLMHYLESDETWQSRDGQEWSIPRLISEELKQPIRGAACGGTHRLMGLSYAVNKRIKRGEPVDGEYRRAQIFINDYHRYTFGLQNPDGSFSTQWFVRREAKPDVDRRLKTTGHILEWLCFSLSDEELRQPQVVRAVDYLTTSLATGQDHTWEIGPLGHGLHALGLYDWRMFRDPSSGKAPNELPPPEVPLARTPAVPAPAPLSRSAALPERKTPPKTTPPKTTPAKIAPPAVAPLKPVPGKPMPGKPLPHPQSVPNRPVLEMADKPSLLDLPACRIGNDEGELAPPPGAERTPDEDDEGCL